MEVVMSLMLEAIIITIVMLFIFAAAFVTLLLLALAMVPVERGMSKIIWESTAPKRRIEAQPGGTFRDFSSKH